MFDTISAVIKKKTVLLFTTNVVFLCSKVSAASDHKPGGGDVKIFSEKIVYNVTSKIGSFENAKHVPGTLGFRLLAIHFLYGHLHDTKTRASSDDKRISIICSNHLSKFECALGFFYQQI